MTLRLSWPSAHLLGLAPIGGLDPQLLGLAWAIPITEWDGEPEAKFLIREPWRVKVTRETLAQLALTMRGDHKRILDATVGRLHAAVTGA